MKSLNEVRQRVLAGEEKTIAIAAAEDQPVLEAIRDCLNLKLAKAILVGNQKKIETYLAELDMNPEQVTIVHQPDQKLAAAAAVQLVREGQAQVLMKGLIGTADFMRAVLDKERGLRTGAELTHIAVMESPKMNRLILMTDAAMHMYPELTEKVKILQMAEQLCRVLEIPDPKAAVIGAVEVVNPAMAPTMDGAVLAKMSDRGQIKGLKVDGPLALDVALSEEAAHHKNLTGEVAGRADVLLMPGIEAGNVMWKTLVYLSDAQIAGLIMGAAAPIVLTSRSDSPETKLNSIALALLAGSRWEGNDGKR